MRPAGLATAAALLLLCASAIAPAGSGEVERDAYTEALELYRGGRHSAAAEIIERRIAEGEAAAAHRALLGWCYLRLGRLDEAAVSFAAAIALNPRSPDALTGRGFVELRLGRSPDAARTFRQALELQPDSADAWKGLGLALEQQGDARGARQAFTRAVELDPSAEESRQLLERNRTLLIEELRPRGPVDPSQPLRVATRAHQGRLEVRLGPTWRPIFVKGINLGTSLPGKFPAEFPDDEELYRRWFDSIGELGANVVRLYTLHPPSLYRALAAHNRERPDRKLWLVQGAWTELPPGDDYDDPVFSGRFRAEIRRVVDAVHGNLVLPPRPGSAHGVYDVDLSGDLLAFVLGREWEPFSVDAYNRLRPQQTRFEGTYVRTGRVQPIEAWLASILETAAAHETEHYRMQHPVSWVSWPTLDPLFHPTEATVAEEMKFRGEPSASRRDEINEYDNDLVQVDSTLIEATAALPAGLFASYHVYPYYPEFMILDPDYGRVRDELGISRYLGYLRELKRHHGDQPVLIAEFGVPTSRGIAHLHPEGQHHGGHTTREQGEIDARLLRNIHQAGLAGGILFAWMDEWFKRNWLVMNYEAPVHRNPLWLSALDAEQNFGLLAARPGATAWRVVLDGRADDWSDVPALYARTEERSLPRAGIRAFRVTSDEAFLYLALELAETDHRTDGDGVDYWIGIDSYDADRGEHRFPAPLDLTLPIGMEFLIQFAGTEQSRLLVARPYDLFTQRNRRPYRSTPSDNGDFIEIRTFTNRERYGRDGSYYPAKGYSRSPLRHGTTDPESPGYDSLADWFASDDARLIEARIPWGLLNVADPSSHRVIHEDSRTEGVVETAATEGFRFHLLALNRSKGTTRVVDSLPARPSDSIDYPIYRWPSWERPSYRLEFKHSYAIFRETLGTLPD